MANLTYEDKIYLEKYLQMESGWLLDFGNDSLQRFVFDSIKIDIYDNKYDKYGGSKAKRIRAIWDKESDYIIGKLMKSFIEYYKAKSIVNPDFFNSNSDLEEKCFRIIERLSAEGISPHIDLIQPSFDESDFTKLAKAIKDCIENNDPELALDRLHTFYMKYIRDLCAKNNVTFSNDESLNAIYGKFIKFIDGAGLLESEMTKAIMKYSINLLEKYNDVRNNKSLAHDNKLLNYKESLYVFDTLARLKGFIDSIQEEIEQKQKIDDIQEEVVPDWGDLPF
jgi:hypothetical protein